MYDIFVPLLLGVFSVKRYLFYWWLLFGLFIYLLVYFSSVFGGAFGIGGDGQDFTRGLVSIVDG